MGSLVFPFAANLWGLEAGRHWLAVGGAVAGFAAMWALRPAQENRPGAERLDGGFYALDKIDKNLTNGLEKASELTVRRI